MLHQRQLFVTFLDRRFEGGFAAAGLAETQKIPGHDQERGDKGDKGESDNHRPGPF